MKYKGYTACCFRLTEHGKEQEGWLLDIPALVWLTVWQS